MKKLTITILILLTVIVAGCFKQPVVNDNQNVNTDTFQIKDADGWKTYTNKYWGISFRFKDNDNEIAIKETLNSDLESIAIIFQNMNKPLSRPSYLSRRSFYEDYPLVDNLEEYIQTHGDKQEKCTKKGLDSYKPIKVDNVNGYEVYATVFTAGEDCSETENRIVKYIYFDYSKIRKNGIKFDYLIIGSGEDENFINQILETFQFID